MLEDAKFPLPPPGKTGWPWTEETKPLPPLMPNGKPWPRISIVTTSYNRRQYLEQTIRSVLLQNYPNLEYLIIDGGSSDGSADVIKHYSTNDKRIRWVSEKDNGISDAMNKGISMATGEIVAHLHSDDYYADSNILSTVSSAFARNDSSYWLTGGIYIVDNNGKRLTTIKVRNYAYNNLVEANTILHPSTFIIRKAFTLVGMFDLSLSYAMDYDLWLRLGMLGDPLLIDASLTCFRAHKGSISTANSGKAFDEAWRVRIKYLKSNPLKLLRGYLSYLRSRKYAISFNRSLLSG
jgi:glycosyltransferase involved in cell wall biosynthesis